MPTTTDKTPQQQPTNAPQTAERQSGDRATAQFSDNRPEAVVQLQVQDMADQSPPVEQTVQLQAAIDGSPYMAAQAERGERLFGAGAPTENKTGLPDQLKTNIEQMSGFSMDDVRVHFNSGKPAQLQAHAYAQGTDIHVAPGQERHLGHEAWHVVQQMQGRVEPTLQMKRGVEVNDDVGLEKEADVMGAKAKNHLSTSVSHGDVLKPTDLSRESFPVQRLKIDECPVIAINPGISNAVHLGGGNKGELFILERKAKKEKLVAKFQNEEPIEALMGTDIMRSVGAESPSVREANEEDYANIVAGLRAGTQEYELNDALLYEFIEEKEKKKHFLLMEFATGSTIKELRDKRPLELIKALGQKSFGEGLGKIIAADVFAGNPDRMFARWGSGEEVVGWYHEENLFIDNSDVNHPKAVAIDNAFSPKVVRVTQGSKPWGLYGEHGMQFGSVAAAHPETMKIEAGVIYDFMLQTILDAHIGNPEVEEEVENARNKKAAFVGVVAQSGTVAMKDLLEHSKRFLPSVEAFDLNVKAMLEKEDNFFEKKRLQSLEKTKTYFSERIAYLWAINNSDGTVESIFQACKETIKT